MPVARVRRELQRLIEAGCEIAEHPQGGVALVKTGLGSWEDYLRWRLDAPAGERTIQVYKQTASTQDVVRRIAARRDVTVDGAIVVADHQRAGRGRLGRKWYAPAGSCALFSMLCAREARGAEMLSPDRLVFATSVAVARGMEAAAEPASLQVQIKWPNDLMVGGRKIGGILVEVAEIKGGRVAVIGVGINANLDVAHLPAGAVADPKGVTSLRNEGIEVDRLAVLAESLVAMDAVLVQKETEPLLGEWRQRSLLLGRRITARSAGRTYRGEVMDIDPMDGLIVRTASGEHVHLSAQTTTIL